MKSVRVNLIKRSEVRYQGAVSPKFLTITLGSAVAAVLLLLMVVRTVQYAYRKRQLVDARVLWAQMEPRFKQLNQPRNEVGAQKKLVDELGDWREKAARWSEFMLILQRSVPPQIQLGRMQLSRDAASDGTEVNRFSVKGWSEGADAESVVIGWRRALMNDPGYTNLFVSLELGHLRLAGSTMMGDQSRRSFELVGEGPVILASGEAGEKK
jgi:hypothetical protein